MAAPVASQLALSGLADVADQIVCVVAPEPFYAVGEWYDDFSQTSDGDVLRLLRRAAGRARAGPIRARRVSDGHAAGRAGVR